MKTLRQLLQLVHDDPELHHRLPEAEWRRIMARARELGLVVATVGGRPIWDDAKLLDDREDDDREPVEPPETLVETLQAVLEHPPANAARGRGARSRSAQRAAKAEYRAALAALEAHLAASRWWDAPELVGYRQLAERLPEQRADSWIERLAGADERELAAAWEATLAGDGPTPVALAKALLADPVSMPETLAPRIRLDLDYLVGLDDLKQAHARRAGLLGEPRTRRYVLFQRGARALRAHFAHRFAADPERLVRWFLPSIPRHDHLNVVNAILSDIGDNEEALLRKAVSTRPIRPDATHTRLTEVVEIIPGVAMTFCWCPPGEFQMGDEHRERMVVNEGFWIGKYPITRMQWFTILRKKLRRPTGSSLPMGSATINQVIDLFLALYSKTTISTPSFHIGLPTEVEWEYACRAWTRTAFWWGDRCNGREANCDGRQPYGTRTPGPCLGRKTPVGRYGENPWGLCDTHGNVAEWCFSRTVRDRIVALDETEHNRDRVIRVPLDDAFVLRGGGFDDPPRCCSAGYRRRFERDSRGGVRLTLGHGEQYLVEYTA